MAMKCIGVVSQKGGAGKSTLAREIARQFSEEGWRVKIADLDLGQTTSTVWNTTRQQSGIQPEISVETFKTPQKAMSISGFDMLIFDGRPLASSETRLIAELSDLVVIPARANTDDLRPQVLLALELQKAGIPKGRMIFVLNGVMDPNGQAVEDAKEYIRSAGFSVANQAIPVKTSYESAMNEGRSLSEVNFPTLRKIALDAVEEIALRLAQTEKAQ